VTIVIQGGRQVGRPTAVEDAVPLPEARGSDTAVGSPGNSFSPTVVAAGGAPPVSANPGLSVGRFEPFRAEDIARMSSADLTKLLTPLLQNHVSTYNYDSLALWNSVAARLRAARAERPDLPLRETLRAVPWMLASNLAEFSGDVCFGLAEAVISELDAMGIKAFVVGSTLPGNGATLVHGAAALAFENPDDPEDAGFILLDPGLNISKPLVLKQGKPETLELAGSSWELELNPTSSLCHMTRIVSGSNDGAERSTFRMEKWLGLDGVSADVALKFTQKPKIVARDENGNVIGAVLLNPGRNRITLRAGDVAASHSLDSDDWKTSITDDFASLLKTTRARLMARIEEVAALATELDGINSPKGSP
jgi:hypothetical protein